MTRLVPLLLTLAVGSAWHGWLELPSTSLPLEITVETDSTASLASPFQHASGIPAAISVADDTLRFSSFPLGASFEGVAISSDTVEGVFTQRGHSFPLVLERGPLVIDRPQEQALAVWPEEEVQFFNPADSACLRGTLTLPDSVAVAVVMVTGSGLQNRDEELIGHRPFAVIADALARQGIASLRYDDRGFGASTGTVDTASTHTFAADAAAAIAYLHGRGFERVGVLGHSEGGTIAFMLPEADFIIALAPAVVPGDSTLLYQNRLLLASRPDVPEGYLEGLPTLYGYMKRHPGLRSLPADSLGVYAHLREAYLPIVSSRNPWFDTFLAFDPAPYVASSTVPVLAIAGELDAQVDPEANLSLIRRLRPDATTVILPGLNHLLQPAVTGLPAEYPKIPLTIDPTVLHLITDLKHLTRR